MQEKQNPKLEGTGILDCIPQTGKCPVGCIECFYNGPHWYRTRDEPLIPTKKEAKGKIVRFNSGHDSNIQRETVIELSKNYDDFFFNTTYPNFNFPGPVVFTCNGRPMNEKTQPDMISHFTENLINLMFVRHRINTWNYLQADFVISWYTSNFVPVVMTFMRYLNENNIPDDHKQFYEKKKNVSNVYYKIKKEKKKKS